MIPGHMDVFATNVSMIFAVPVLTKNSTELRSWSLKPLALRRLNRSVRRRDSSPSLQLS